MAGAPPPPWAVPPAAQALPRRAGEQLYNAVSGMSPAAWGDPAQLGSMLARCEALLCALHGSPSLAAYVERMAGGGGGQGPCTHVWTAGTIAYRCRTCGLSPSAAVCVDCFRASDHEGHDYVMYTSDAGGCCDCGDMSSWRPQGCCPRHRPPGEGQAEEPPPLPPADDALLHGVVGCVLARLQLALEGSLPHGEGQAQRAMAARELDKAAALHMIAWLGRLAQAPVLRRVVCEEMLQPVSAAAAMQAASLEATAGLPPEAAAVARMLNQQREGLLQSLEAALPVPGNGAGPGRPLPLPAQGRQLSLLYWQLSTLLPLDGQLVEELATLHILLLYSTPFKEHFGLALLCFYPHIGALGKRHAITQALDRLTVQVFHLEETTLALVQHGDLLEVLLTALAATLRRAVGEDGRLHGDSPVMSGRLYLRIAADLHMALSHPAVVLQLLAGPRGHLFPSHFLPIFRLIEGGSPFRRKLGDHVLYESEAWVNMVQVEVHLMHMLKQGALHTLLKAAEAGTVQPHAAAAALAFGLRHCVEAVEAAAGALHTAEEPHSFWATVLSGQGQISAHIPLERLAATFLGGLLHLAHVSPAPQPYLDAAAEALGWAADGGAAAALVEPQPAAAGGAVDASALAQRRWEMCGLAAERITAWMSQIRQRLWVRNGQALLRLEAFYASPYWSDHGQDSDLLAMQAWLACTLNLSRALGFLTVDSGAVHLLKASSAASMAEAAGVLAGAHGSQELLRCAADWLRLLVILLRERSLWHPTYSPLQLRRAVVHVLAAGARSHSEVGDELPYELAHSPDFDEVLAAVADYLPPTAAATGRYSLRRECWREFDPFYPHYSRRDLQTALHTAQERGIWQPEWQLERGLPPLPPPMAGLQRVLHHMLRLVWTALLLACCAGSGAADEGGGGGAAEDCALAAVTLLCLACQRKRADLAAMLAGEAAAPGAPPLPDSWRSPAGFRAKCEEHLAGRSDRPGIIHLLRVLAGSERWVDGSSREASWELKRCAAAAAEQAQQLLAAAQQAAPAAAAAEQPAVAREAAVAAAAGAGPAPQPGGQAPAESPAAASQPPADADSSKKRQAKQRQQQMLARMRAQQAKAAAALLEASEDEEGPEGAAAQQQQQQAQPAEEGPADMAVDAQATPAEAASRQQAALPAHHPAAWEQQAGAECALCHSGSEMAPLGLVAQLQPTELPVMAAGEPTAPLTPDQPGVPGGSLGAAATEEGEPAAVQPFPLPGCGPRLSVFDRQPSLHLLCCGHMLHAACLERYRASWRQRIASGQFVEGFQLLQPSPAAGEYLCPICRRLGNCLLPMAARAAEAGPAPQPGEQQEQPALLSSAAALQRLHQLLAEGGANWAAAAATASARLQEEWGWVRGRAGALEALPPQRQAATQLIPRFGSQAEGVAALCEATKLAGSKWISQQHRVLEWLQQRASEEPEGPSATPLWGIPVQALPTGQPAHPPAQQSLQAALHQLLDQAVDEGGDVEAMGAIAQMAAAVAEIEEEMEELAESEEEEEGEGGGAPAGAAAVPGIFQQLQQQAVAAAEDAALAHLPPHAGEAGAVAVGQPASATQQHTHRLWAGTAAGAGGVLWSLLGSGVAQWEVAHRDPACMPSAEVDAAHWRALRSLAQLSAAAYSPPEGAHAAVAAALQHLGGGALGTLGADACGALPDVSAALMPSLLQLQAAPLSAAYADGKDPCALLLQLLAVLLTHPRDEGEPASLTRSAHRQPGAVLQALLALLYPVAVGQAVALATAAARPVAEAAEALASSPPLATALEGAVSSQLLPWLQRSALLVALLCDAPAPAAPSLAGGSAAAAVQALLRELGLPPLWAALQSPAASSLPPPAGEPAWQQPQSMHLSVHAGGQQWEVLRPPPPQPPKLLQLPASYQGWYLALGARHCSVCGKAPPEPALCLRCGAVMCCNGRRCVGPARQGMCYTHAQACGGGTCCFLLTKMTRLLVIRKNRATFLASPYVDSHGEEDVRLHRGKPLSLHPERLRHLLQLWRSSGLDFDSQVLHAANHRNEFASIY